MAQRLDLRARAILELGTGTGETARRLLALHPRAELVGVDSSDEMLAAAGRLLDRERVDLRIPVVGGPGSYTQKLWTALRKKAAYLPG